MRQHPLFQDVVVSKNYPGQLVIEVHERQPFAILLADEVYCLDRTGFVFPKLETQVASNLPVITGIQLSPAYGESLSAAPLHEAIQLIERIQQEYPALYKEISEINYYRDELSIYLNLIHARVIWGTSEDLRRKSVYLLAAIEAARHHRFPEVDEIDLRYDGQIITR